MLGFVCPRRNIVQTKSEELTRAIAWALIPLAIAYLWAVHNGHLHSTANSADWKAFFAGAYGESGFEKHQDDFFRAQRAIFVWNFSLLWRLYFIVFVFWLVIDLLIARYGRIRASKFASDVPALKLALDYFILPRVSEWHVCLSNMLTENKDITVHADVLTKADVLYRGRVVDKMLAPDGSLASITLAGPGRFRRADYLDAKRQSATNKEEYWVEIKGAMFIIMGSEISTINLRHSSASAVSGDEEVVKVLRSLLKRYAKRQDKRVEGQAESAS